MQVADLENEFWFALKKMVGKTCKKHHFGDNLRFMTQKNMNPTDLDSP